MEKKLNELLLVLGGIAVSLFAVTKILSGTWGDILWFMICLIPFVMALFLGLRNWWPVMALAVPLIPLPTSSMVLLDKFTPSMVFNLALLAFFLGHICIRHRGVSLATKYARPMLVVAVMITARLVMNPPGSGRTGGTGGLSMALNYWIAGWGFFAIWWATKNSTLSEKHLVKILMVFATGVFVWRLSGSPRYHLYHREAWIFWSFLLGWVAYRKGALENKWWIFYLLSMIVMACGVTHAHRKSVVMAGLTCMTIAWIFRVEKKQMIILGVSGFLGLSLLLVTGHVPGSMKRALSTVLPRSMLHLEAHEEGSYGLQDDFRALNMEFAVKDIARHPLIGRGFTFSTASVVAMLNRSERSGMAGSSELAGAVGTHHYGFISLLTHIGAIVPWFFAVALLGILYQFMKLGRAMESGWPKVLVAGLSGYFINNLFQWLYNGAGSQMLVLSIALGIMMGLMQRWNLQERAELAVPADN